MQSTQFWSWKRVAVDCPWPTTSDPRLQMTVRIRWFFFVLYMRPSVLVCRWLAPQSQIRRTRHLYANHRHPVGWSHRLSNKNSDTILKIPMNKICHTKFIMDKTWAILFILRTNHKARSDQRHMLHVCEALLLGAGYTDVEKFFYTTFKIPMVKDCHKMIIIKKKISINIMQLELCLFGIKPSYIYQALPLCAGHTDFKSSNAILTMGNSRRAMNKDCHE